MEHLPRVGNPVYDIEVPCLCEEAEPYDGFDFATFPSRKGLDLQLYPKPTPSGHEKKPAHEAAAILQAWLFFGMLAEVMGIPINPDDFRRVDPRSEKQFITTALLNNYLERWVSAVTNDQSREDKFDKAAQCLQRVAHFVNLDPENKTLLLLPAEVLLSIRLVAERLVLFGYVNIWHQGSHLWGVPIQLRSSLAGSAKVGTALPGFGGEFLVKSQFMKEHTKHWCPSERNRLSRLLTATALVHLSRLPPLPSEKSHEQCTEKGCTAYNIDNDTYKPRHVAGCNGCRMVGPDKEELNNVVKNGKLPLIHLGRPSASGEVKVTLVSKDTSVPFTALSHVWSDGLGNTSANEIAECQAKRIASILAIPSNKHYSPSSFKQHQLDEEDVTFLTTRRPRSYPLEAEFQQELKQLQSTGHEERLLEYVREVDGIKRTQTPRTERGFSAEQPPFHGWSSQWGQKLHELTLSTVSTPEAMLSLSAAMSAAKVAVPGSQTGEPSTEHAGTTTADKDLTPLNAFWLDTLCIPVEKAARRKAVAEMNDVYRAAERVVIIDSSLAEVSTADKAENIIARLALSGWSRRLWTFPEGMLAKSKLFVLKDALLDFDQFEMILALSRQYDTLLGMLAKKSVPHRRLGILEPTQFLRLRSILGSNQLAFRSLSRPGDEALCLARSLDFAPDQVRSIIDAHDEDKMCVFWSALKEIPQGLLVWSGPRLDQPGFRWAPSTLRNYSFNYFDPGLTPSAAIRTDRGLQLKLPGWIFTALNDVEEGFSLWEYETRAMYDVDRNTQALSGNGKWISASRDRPERYALIVLSKPYVARHVLGVLVSVVEEARDVVYARFVNNIRMRLCDPQQTEVFAASPPRVMEIMSRLRGHNFLTSAPGREMTWVVG
ncbi:hypothetical protein QQZ08_009103 [Neonectria magnoliae]|uniref:Heterokaryon incompatibility domain-containing protein n=1 Tax=Neonectria magnoliae TaxID=2732573 RepID=A0ABR1HRD0_9HYPO